MSTAPAKYEAETIASMLERIDSNKLLLPALQRSFVWGTYQIERLFDSLLQGYPIGTFLLWQLGGEDRRNFSFYRFLLNYHERDKPENEPAARPITAKQVMGVLDGQQRLNALYIGLQGTYAFRQRYARKGADHEYPERSLHWNVLAGSAISDEDEEVQTFSFLTAKESADVDTTHCWFAVRELMSNPGAAERRRLVRDIAHRLDGAVELSDRKRETILEQMARLTDAIHRQKLINYYTITGREHAHILEIFVRLNGAGTFLSKSDLLFSTIVAHWPEGRTSVESLLREINTGTRRFNFSKDFVMRACLVLSDGPARFAVGSFGPANVEHIRDNWDNIAASLREAVRLIIKWGFTEETLTAPNAIIPIAYFLYKGGDTKRSEEAWRLYLVRSLVNQVYGAQGDRVLVAFRDGIRREKGAGKKKTFPLKNNRVTLDDLVKIKLPGRKSLEVRDGDLDEFLSYWKGPYSFLILALLYPDFSFETTRVDQDHIFPADDFKKRNLKVSEVPKSKWETFGDLCHQVPNLRLETESKNRERGKTPYLEWIQRGRTRKVAQFKQDHIPADAQLEIQQFEQFFEKRRKLLKQKLGKVLKVGRGNS